jgi:hypothetical protein
LPKNSLAVQYNRRREILGSLFILLLEGTAVLLCFLPWYFVGRPRFLEAPAGQAVMSGLTHIPSYQDLWSDYPPKWILFVLILVLASVALNLAAIIGNLFHTALSARRGLVILSVTCTAAVLILTTIASRVVVRIFLYVSSSRTEMVPYGIDHAWIVVDALCVLSLVSTWVFAGHEYTDGQYATLQRPTAAASPSAANDVR